MYLNIYVHFTFIVRLVVDVSVLQVVAVNQDLVQEATVVVGSAQQAVEEGKLIKLRQI